MFGYDKKLYEILVSELDNIPYAVGAIHFHSQTFSQYAGPPGFELNHVCNQNMVQKVLTTYNYC